MKITPGIFIHRHFWTWETWSEVTCSGDTEKEAIETKVSHGPAWVQGSSLWTLELLLFPAEDPLQLVGHVAVVPCISTEGIKTFS